MVNVEEFYEEDERRRSSAEVTFGLEWNVSSESFVLYGLHWVEATREIYVLREPQAPRDVSAAHGSYGFPIRISGDAYEVIVLGTAESREILETALDGWEEQVAQPDSLQWVRQRLYEAASQNGE